MRLELVPIGVSEVDRSKAWYADKAGFDLNGMDGISNLKPGSITGPHLVVKT